ncbi:glycosyltransferase family 39 protein [Pedobacter sp. P351]|uniref:ArnT family glycosyltransferase n=1 Tax=Pedobacter superstes TaxID=3133441 RepID=UPI0030A4AF7F
MQKIENYISRFPGKTFAALLFLAIPPFLINLGLLPLFADEPTRANVALEMILSGNYSVPTIGGEYYYNKPPVYNWLLTLVYQISGSFSEFATRLPAVVPLFLFAITIYYSAAFFLKDKRIALLSAILSMVNGRMLIYDSMLGHIDIFYSWLTFISFMCIFYFYQKKHWFLLFFTSYIITAIGFLCKGMPSIVFQGVTLITLLIYTNNFRRLFSWQHIVSGVVCLLLIASYFFNYSLYNSNLEGYFSTIWDQSSQRTAASVGLWKSMKHIFLFPFEYAGHLFPASLLLLFCFHKEFIKQLMRNSFLKFCGLIFLANILVYWLSPETRPRYLLMLFPLLFFIWSHAYYTFRDNLPKLNRVFESILIGLCVLVTLVIPFAFLFNIRDYISFFSIKVLVVFLLAALLTYLIIKFKTHRLVAFLAFLLVVRLGFSWLVLPHRLQRDEGRYFRSIATEIGKMSGQEPFYFYQYHPHVASIPFHDKLIFYIQRSRMKQVNFTEVDTVRGYYLTFDRDLKNQKAVLLKTYNSNLKLYKVK